MKTENLTEKLSAVSNEKLIKFMKFSRVFFMIVMFLMCFIYLILLLPLFYISPVFGVGNHVGTWPPNGFLSNFGIVWQLVCAFFYSLAFAKLAWPRKIFSKTSRIIFVNLPLLASLIESLVLNIYQVLATRISSHYVDGIFTQNGEFPVYFLVFYVSFVLIVIVVVNFWLRVWERVEGLMKF